MFLFQFLEELQPLFLWITMQHLGAILIDIILLLAVIIHNTSLYQDKKLNFMQIWYGELYNEIKHRQAQSCVSQDTPSIQTDCSVILSCHTAANFITQSSDCDRRHLPSEAMQNDLQEELKVMPSGCWHLSNWFLSSGSTPPQSSSTTEQLVCSLKLPALSRKKVMKVLDHSWVYKVPWCHCIQRSINLNDLVI